MAEATITVSAQNLTRSFGSGEERTIAVHEASLELRAGEMSLLMGPSGSGKTTLLAMLSGLLRPDSGQVLALGRDLWQSSDEERERFRLRHCGFIFQGANLMPALNARDHLEMVLRWGERMPWAEAKRKTSDMLDLLGLSRKGKLLPEHLSGGEKQRVAIGRALIKEPDLFFADEPTSALDWEHGKHIVELLRDTAHRGATVVMVTHDHRILPYADRIYRLEDGRLTGEEAAAKSASLGAS
ncbi:MAG TPA: ABC transporter ATP-binding protein [Gemmataceae bacterium]|nr:ABC transporter ATP-binding protein [Gemmataceae bacterium]